MGKHFNNIFATLIPTKRAMVASLLSLRVEHTKYATKYRFALMPLFRPEKNNRVLFANVDECVRVSVVRLTGCAQKLWLSIKNSAAFHHHHNFQFSNVFSILGEKFFFLRFHIYSVRASADKGARAHTFVNVIYFVFSRINFANLCKTDRKQHARNERNFRTTNRRKL